MSNMTPFEIRLELLKMAKDMLTEDYYGKREQVSNDWTVKVEVAKLNGGTIPDHPGYPTYPSEKDIIASIKMTLSKDQIATFVNGLHEVQEAMLEELVKRAEAKGFPDVQEIIKRVK